MREILFRGKRKDNNEWVYGNLIKFSKEKTYIKTESKNNYEIVEKTIGQYTDLKDMNNKKIFEGDIIAGADYEEENGYGVVKWIDGAFWVGNNQVCGTICNNYYGYEFEVIGNIYDNPKLLKDGKENKFEKKKITNIDEILKELESQLIIATKKENWGLTCYISGQISVVKIIKEYFEEKKNNDLYRRNINSCNH